MKHPLTQASEHAKYVIDQMRELIDDAPHLLAESIDRYQRTLERVNAHYNVNLKGTFVATAWSAKMEKLKHWSSVFESDEGILNPESFWECYRDFLDTCNLVKKHWAMLKDEIETINGHLKANLPKDNTPPADRYIGKCVSEVRQIDTSFTDILGDCRKGYGDMRKILVDSGVDSYSLNVTHGMIRVKSTSVDVDSDSKEFDATADIEGIEWHKIDFSTNPMSRCSHLHRCRFSECSFPESPYTGLLWDRVHFHKCSGQLELVSSVAEISTSSCGFEKLYATNSRVKSLSVNSSSIDHIKIDNGSSIENLHVADCRGTNKITTMTISSAGPTDVRVIRSEAEVLILQGSNQKVMDCSVSLEESSIDSITAENTNIDKFCSDKSEKCFFVGNRSPIGECLITDSSKLFFKLHLSDIQSVNVTRSLVFVETTRGIIGRQEWLGSNACVISHGSNPMACHVSSGSYEAHRLKPGSHCVLVFDRVDLLRSSSPFSPQYATMGRLLQALHIEEHDEVGFKQGMTMDFYHSQLLSLFKYKVDIKMTFLQSAIAKGVNKHADQEPFYDDIMKAFSRRIKQAIDQRPVQVALLSQRLGKRDKQFLLDVLTPMEPADQLSYSQSNPTGSNLDTNFCYHLMKTLEFYGSIGEKKCLDGRMLRVKKRLYRLVTEHIRTKQINGHLLDLIYQEVSNVKLRRPASRRTSSDHIIRYLTSLTSWYMSMKQRANECVSRLKEAMVESSDYSLGPREILRQDSSLQVFVTIADKSKNDRMKELSTIDRRTLREEVEGNDWRATEDADREYLGVVISHMRDLLEQYRPAFAWHIKGQTKLAIIRKLMEYVDEIIAEVDITKKRCLISELSGHVNFVMGNVGEPNSEALFPLASTVSGGSSRSVRGYLTTIRLVSHLLVSVKGRKAFFEANLVRSRQAHRYFRGLLNEEGRVKVSIMDRTRQTLRERLVLMENTLRVSLPAESYPDGRFSINASDIVPLTLDEQLSNSKILIDDIKNARSWKPDRVNRFLSLRYAYDKRENEDFRDVDRISFVNGEVLYTYAPSNRSESPTSSFSGSGVKGDHVEMTVIRSGLHKKAEENNATGADSVMYI